MRGHIERRGDRWRVTIDQGRDAVTGRRRRVSRTAATKGEAEQLARELGGQRAPTRAKTVGQLLDAWFEQVPAEEWSATTRKGYRSKLEQYLRPQLGDLPLRQLTPERIDRFYKTLRTTKGVRGKALSVATVRRTHAVLAGACDQAVRWGWLPSNPAKNAKPGRASRNEIQPPPVSEILAVLEQADIDFADVIVLALATGARRGELAGIQWCDVDLDEGAVTFRRSVADVKGGTQIIDDRRKSKTRTVTIHADCVDRLRARRARAAAKALEVGVTLGAAAFVLSNEPGQQRPIRPERITGRWRDAAEKAGSKARFHDLRHAHITQLLAAGIPVSQVGPRVGHRSGSHVTLAVYGHALEQLDRRAADVIAEAINNG